MADYEYSNIWWNAMKGEWETTNESMSIKHLTPKTPKEIESLPFWKRTEVWQSPMAIFLVIGYIIDYIGFGNLGVLKWLLF